jgi:transposase
MELCVRFIALAIFTTGVLLRECRFSSAWWALLQRVKRFRFFAMSIPHWKRAVYHDRRHVSNDDGLATNLMTYLRQGCSNGLASQVGVWDQLMNALTAGHDTAVQMIDTSIVRVHQHGASIAGNSEQLMGRSRGGLTTKIHAVVDTCGLPVRLALTTGEAHDDRLVSLCCPA